MITKQKLLETLKRRFISETYVSDDDNLYCPMCLVDDLFAEAISKYSAGEAFVFDRRYSELIENWSDRVLMPVEEGEALQVRDVDLLTINPDGSVIATTTEGTKLRLDISTKRDLSELKLLGITEAFITAFRRHRDELSALPDIIYVMREIIPDFAANTTKELKSITTTEIFNNKNDETLDLLIRMSPDILNDLEILFSKFDTYLS